MLKTVCLSTELFYISSGLCLMLRMLCIVYPLKYLKIAADLCSMLRMVCLSPEISYIAAGLCSMIRMRCLSPEISYNCCRVMFDAKNGMFIP